MIAGVCLFTGALLLRNRARAPCTSYARCKQQMPLASKPHVCPSDTMLADIIWQGLDLLTMRNSPDAMQSQEEVQGLRFNVVITTSITPSITDTSTQLASSHGKCTAGYNQAPSQCFDRTARTLWVPPRPQNTLL